MKIEFNALSKKIIIEPYTSFQEKELMLVQSYTDINQESALDIALDILKVSKKTIKKLSIDEKKALIYKFREISVGETIEIKYICQHCKSPCVSKVYLNNIIKKPVKHSEYVVDLHRLPVDEKDLRENFLKNINQLDYEEYENIAYNIKDYLTYYDFNAQVICFNCKNKNNISLYSNKFILDAISDESIQSLYKTYQALIYYGKWNKADIDNLYPFERQIFINLLNKTIEEQNKKIKR